MRLSWYGCCQIPLNHLMKISPWICTGLCLLICSGLPACSPKITPPVNTSSAEETPVAENMERSILYYVNQHRRSLGKPVLQLSDMASEQAYRHSRNMANRKTGFGHEGFEKRMELIKKQSGWISASAENVAYGKLSAKEVVKGWLNSPGHKKNIEGNYQFTGIGVYKDSKGILFFTQIFFRK